LDAPLQPRIFEASAREPGQAFPADHLDFHAAVLRYADRVKVRPVLLVLLCVSCKAQATESNSVPPPADEEADADVDVEIDPSADASGALARAAAVLEVDGVDSEDLRSLSHHAEKLPSASVVCKHMQEVRGSAGGITDCIEEVEHQIVRLGPEIWASASACFTGAQSVAQLDACAEAEAEAEAFLHENPHGDGLDESACRTFFETFQNLAVEDAPEDAAHVEQVLETVRDDIVRSCMEHGTQAEMDCSAQAKTLEELETCADQLV
jgi:hypothetical protein